MNRPFIKEVIQTANKHMNKCLTPSTIREVQIKTTKRHHYKPTRMAKIKKKQQGQYPSWRGRREIRSFIHCCWECKRAPPLWKKLSVSYTTEHAITV